MEKFPLWAVIASTLMINFSLSRRMGIIGGERAMIQNFPYQAAYLSGGKFKCGASLLSGSWGLTAGERFAMLRIITGEEEKNSDEKHQQHEFKIGSKSTLPFSEVLRNWRFPKNDLLIGSREIIKISFLLIAFCTQACQILICEHWGFHENKKTSYWLEKDFHSQKLRLRKLNNSNVFPVRGTT